MYPRRLTLQANNHAHVFFRCHNRKDFFKDPKVKTFLVRLWVKYHKHYCVKVFDFNIMDNHAHILLKAENVEGLGHFMRTVNSQLARFINKFYERDSQAIRERYRSPKICSDFYFDRVRAYVWLNRYKVDKSDPAIDPFCSASWRLNGCIAESFAEDEEKKNDYRNFLSPYECGPKNQTPKEQKKYVRDLLNAAMSMVQQLKASVLCHGHTISDKDSVAYRKEYFSAYRREHVPWVPTSPDSKL